MASNTKIFVLKSKELIYTGIFIILGIMLILLLFYMFSPSDGEDKNTTTASEATSEEATETMANYIPGVYSSQLNIGGSALSLSVSVDEHTITGVTIENLDETVTAMYPLIQPSLDEINAQIGLVSSVEDITYSADNKYTTIIILEAIEDALEDAKK